MLVGYSEVAPQTDHSFTFRILANSPVSVVEMPSLFCYNTKLLCQGGPRVLTNGKLNVNWSLNQKLSAVTKSANQVNIIAKAKD